MDDDQEWPKVKMLPGFFVRAIVSLRLAHSDPQTVIAATGI